MTHHVLPQRISVPDSRLIMEYCLPNIRASPGPTLLPDTNFAFRGRTLSTREQMLDRALDATAATAQGRYIPIKVIEPHIV